MKFYWNRNELKEREVNVLTFDPTASFFLFKIIFCIYFLFVISHSSLSFKSVWLSACISFGAPLLLGTHRDTHTLTHTLPGQEVLVRAGCWLSFHFSFLWEPRRSTEEGPTRVKLETEEGEQNYRLMYIFSLLSPQRSNNKRAQSTYLFSAMVLRDTIQGNNLGKADTENMQAQTQICLEFMSIVWWKITYFIVWLIR